MKLKHKYHPLIYFKKRIKSSPLLFAIMIVFAAFFIGSGIYFAVIGQSRNCSMSFAFTLIVPAFYIIEGLMNIKVSTLFATILMLFSAGTIIGACYDVYTYVIFFDTILHGLWGLVFTVMGFAIVKKFFGEPNSNKSFFGCLLFGFFFCLAMALLWELFEYTGYLVGGYDMEEDEVITEFWSYWLSEGHLHIESVHIDNITQTIIYYGDGQQIVIEGGYLELGLIDTEIDMATCFFCAVAFFIIMTIDWFVGKRLYKWLIPVLNTADNAELKEEPAEEQTESAQECESDGKVEDEAEQADVQSEIQNETQT